MNGGIDTSSHLGLNPDPLDSYSSICRLSPSPLRAQPWHLVRLFVPMNELLSHQERFFVICRTNSHSWWKRLTPAQKDWFPWEWETIKWTFLLLLLICHKLFKHFETHPVNKKVRTKSWNQGQKQKWLQHVSCQLRNKDFMRFSSQADQETS